MLSRIIKKQRLLNTIAKEDFPNKTEHAHNQQIKISMGCGALICQVSSRTWRSQLDSLTLDSTSMIFIASTAINLTDARPVESQIKLQKKKYNLIMQKCNELATSKYVPENTESGNLHF